MSTQVAICNMALVRLGQQRISSLTDTSAAAEVCDVYYEQTRDELLNSYEWSFAVARKQLSAISGDNLSNFDYKYALPTDYLTVRTQISSEDYSDIEDDWRIEGKYLLSDLSPNYIKYIKQVKTASDLPHLFVEAFYLKLATKMVSKLTQDKTLLRNLFREFAIAMRNAEAIIGSNDRNSNPVPTLWSD